MFGTGRGSGNNNSQTNPWFVTGTGSEPPIQSMTQFNTLQTNTPSIFNASNITGVSGNPSTMTSSEITGSFSQTISTAAAFSQPQTTASNTSGSPFSQTVTMKPFSLFGTRNPLLPVSSSHEYSKTNVDTPVLFGFPSSSQSLQNKPVFGSRVFGAPSEKAFTTSVTSSPRKAENSESCVITKADSTQTFSFSDNTIVPTAVAAKPGFPIPVTTSIGFSFLTPITSTTTSLFGTTQTVSKLTGGLFSTGSFNESKPLFGSKTSSPSIFSMSSAFHVSDKEATNPSLLSSDKLGKSSESMKPLNVTPFGIKRRDLFNGKNALESMKVELPKEKKRGPKSPIERPERKRSTSGKTSVFKLALAGAGIKKDTITSRRRLGSLTSEPSDDIPLMKSILTPQQIQSINVIICNDVLEEFNNKHFLQRHFGQFGNVLKIQCSIKKRFATIYFSNHEEAQAAKEFGTKYKDGYPPFKIHFSYPHGLTPKSPKILSARHKVSKSEKMSVESYYDEVKSELDAMAGTGDVTVFRSIREQSPVGLNAFLRRRDKTERMGTPEESTRITSTPLLGDLSKIIKEQAFTARERHRVLDARDRLMRRKSARTMLSMSKTMVGICTDMCPEKERYQRQEQRQISNYEMISGGEYRIDHLLAVKQYSRSSADQEEPLPYELRPSEVLGITMDYLVTNILGRSEDANENLSEWYHFVWDRTRGIRKDIVQQQLCDPLAVSLLEKCARFHIHCATRLCEEDMSSFDQKINNENLTKCLQSLKEMYHDLRAQGIECHNESEFRAYDVLLNLNEGVILRQVQILPEEIRMSPEVTFAVKIFAALDSNNYVKFFKMVEKATYLNSCILQRYFAQVRTVALKIIKKAYCPAASKPVVFSLVDFIRWLGLESVAQASSFLQKYGIEVNMDTEEITFIRIHFQIPESSILLFRSAKLIEGKRNCSIGEVVNGGPLPPNPLEYYTPCNSFDDKGYLTPASLMSCDLTTELEDTPDTSASSIVPKSSPTASKSLTSRITDEKKILKEKLSLERMRMNIILNKTYVLIVDELIDEVCNDMIGEVCQDLMNEIVISSLTATVGRDIFTETLLDMLTNTATEAISELKEVKQNMVQQELVIEKASNILCSQLLEEVENDVIYTVAWEEVWSMKLCKHILEEVVAVEINELVCDAIQQVEMEREAELETIANELRKIRVKKYANRWRQYTFQRKKLKLLLDTFPATCSKLTVAQQLKKLGGPSALNHIPPISLILKQHEETKKLEDLNDCLKSLTDAISIMPIDLVEQLADILVARNQKLDPLTKPPRKDITWKVLVSCLMNSNTEHEINLVRWMNTKLHGRLNTNMSTHVGQVKNYYDVGICISSVFDPETTPANMILGTGGVLVVCPYVNDSKDFSIYRYKLRNLLCSLPKIPTVNLYALFIENIGKNKDHKQFVGDYQWCVGEDGLDLTTLVAGGFINSYNIGICDFKEPFVSVKLLDGIQWLASCNPALVSLVVSPFKYLLENFLSEHVSKEYYQDLAHRRKKKAMHRDPNSLIHLYNSAIDFLCNVCCDSKLTDVSWPIPQLCKGYRAQQRKSKEIQMPYYWNDIKYQDYLNKLFGSLKLPEYRHEIVITWDDVCDTMETYCRGIVKDHTETIIFVQRISNLVNTTRRRLDYFYEESLLMYLPWTDIIQHCFEYQVATMSRNDPFAESDTELLVGYFRDELQAKQLPKEWVSGYVVKPSEIVQNSILSYRSSLTPKRKYEDEGETIPKKLNIEDRDVNPDYIAAKRISKEFRTEAQLLKQSNKHFEELLTRAVAESDPISIFDFDSIIEKDSSPSTGQNVTITPLRRLISKPVYCHQKIFSNTVPKSPSWNYRARQRMIAEQSDQGETTPSDLLYSRIRSLLSDSF